MMGSEEGRGLRNYSKGRKLSIERFAYDVFSCMLPICGFPEKTISSTSIEANDYKDRDFVRKSVLSVLPLSMFVRDSWKRMFEARHSLTPFNSIEFIQMYLKTNLLKNMDFKSSDEATRVRVSLSFFSEITLFFNYKGLETHVNKLPKFWCDFYLEHITKNKDIEGLFAASFFMFPEATESTEWIISFVKKFAVPYGLEDKVSDLFSVYSILSKDSKSSPLKKTSNKDVKDYSSILLANPLETPISKKDASSKAKARGKQSNRVLKLDPVEHQEASSKMGLEDTFGQMSLSSERHTQKFQDGKPKRKKGR